MNTEAIDNLIKDLDLKPGTELFGANGLVKLITKRLVETALEAELEEHLGYPKGEHGDENHDIGQSLRHGSHAPARVIQAARVTGERSSTEP